MALANIYYNYIFTGYDTSQNYTDVAFNSTTFCFVASTTNTVYFGTSSLTTVRVPEPTSRPSGQQNTTTIPVIGFNSIYEENGTFRFGLIDQNTYQVFDLTISVYKTSDFTTFTEEKYKIASAFTYDSIYSTYYPWNFTNIKGAKQFYQSSNRNVVDFYFTGETTYPPASAHECDDFAYIIQTASSSAISETGGLAGSYESYLLGELELFTTTSTDYWKSRKVACYSTEYKKEFVVFNDTVTKFHINDFNGSTTTTQTVSLNDLYSITACDYSDLNKLFVMVGKSGTIIAYEETTTNFLYVQNSTLKNINGIKYNYLKSVANGSYFFICAEGEIYEIYVPQYIYDNNNLPSQLRSYNGNVNSLASQLAFAPKTTSILDSQLQTYYQGTSSLPSQVAIGNVASGTFTSQIYIYTTSGVSQLSSQIRVTGIELGTKINCQLLMSETPTNNFDISFKNKKFQDYGIFVTDWQDSFYKDIDMKDDYTKDGWNINRFNYFGGNSILINGFVITTTISEIQNMLSSLIHETGKLYKRVNFYTIAQLKSFIIEPSTNGYFYNVSMEFLAEKPYYRFERATEIETTITIPSTVTGLQLNNSLIMINDNTSVLMKNTNGLEYFSNGVGYDSQSVYEDYIITTGYQPMGKYLDSSPYYNDISIDGLENDVDYLDKFYNSVGCKFSLPVYINRFYLHFDLLGSMRDFGREFEIYYKDLHTHQWVKYSLPFNVYYENINRIGNCLIFDNLLINTYAIKIRYIGDTTNILKLNDKKTAIIVPKYFSKFYFGNADNGAGSYEYLFDIAENNFFVNLQPKPFDRQMIRIYPKTTYIWANKSITMWIKYKIKDLYFAL